MNESKPETIVTATEVVLPGLVEPAGLQFRERELPAPARGQVLVGVEASGVSFAEQSMRRGRYPGAPKFPFVPGYDLVGIVTAVGPEVDPTLVGQRVAALTKSGGWASHALLTAADLVPVPDGLDAAEAETLVVNGVTAWQMLHRKAKVQAGQTILVHGANGGVGTTLAQLARHHGVRVIGAASPRHHDALRSLGVEPVDYADPELLVARVRELAPGGVDAVFDNLGGPSLQRSWDLLAPKGALVSYALAALPDTASVNMGYARLLARLAWWNLLPNGRSATLYNVWEGHRRNLGTFRARLREEPHHGVRPARRWRADRPGRRPAPTGQGGPSPGARRVSGRARQGRPRPVTGSVGGFAPWFHQLAVAPLIASPCRRRAGYRRRMVDRGIHHDNGAGMTGASDEEARLFAASFRSFLEWVHSEDAAARNHNEVVALITDFLGPDGPTQSVVGRVLPPFEHVNLQTALDAWSAEPGRSVAVHGISIPPHYGPVSLQQLVTGEGIPPLRLSAPSLADLPNGPGSTLACLLLAALLVTDERGSYVVLVAAPSEHSQDLTVEIAGLPVAAAQAVHAEFDELRSRLNVYRGHVVDVSVTPMGGIVLTFADVPSLTRQDVVLPRVGTGQGGAACARRLRAS